MSERQNMAQEYAESVGKGIWEDTQAGHPFGLHEEIEHEGDEACETEECDCTAPARDAYDYLTTDVYDIEYRVSYDGSYRSAELMITGGGPNAYIDTGEHALIVYWGGGKGRWGLPRTFIDALDEAVAEQWESSR
jgi:hypothetical protein